MTSRDFCYWLQGFFELSKYLEVDKDQMESIKKHLDMVFVHEIDPSFPNQKELNKIHNNSEDILFRC